MSTFFIADLHLGHNNMAIKRGFKDSNEHDEFLIKQWNSVVNKHDKVFILGDLSMENAHHYHKLSLLKGLKSVILGNHDRPQDIFNLQMYVQQISGFQRYKGVWLSHCPVHPMELGERCKYNIHGHLHEKLVMRDFDGELDERYINVSCEQNNFVPQLFNNLIKRQ